MAKNRKEIENKYKWNLEKMYLDSSKIEEDIKFIEKSYEDIKEYKGKMSDSAENFYNSLKIMEDSSRRLSYLYAYTHMKHHEDTRINENLADATKSEMIASELGKATAFIVPEIIGMDSSLLETFLKDERIAPYK